jgi:hypothetical protein
MERVWSQNGFRLARQKNAWTEYRTWTKSVQGWPELWASVRALIGIFSQIFRPSLAIRANPVHFSFWGTQGFSEEGGAAPRGGTRWHLESSTRTAWRRV